MSKDKIQEDTRSIINEIEGAIRNCRHGGPLREEEDTQWFRECTQLLATWDPCPIDKYVTSRSGNDDDIIKELVKTTRIISERFKLSIAHVGSRRFLAAIAVDAWFNEDYLYVRKFLLKSIILQHLQHHGAMRVLKDLEDRNINDKNSMFQLIKGVLECHDQGLKSYLEYCTEGRCKCIILSQTINDEREALLGTSSNTNRDETKAKRTSREEERLPPVLKAKSKYWSIKEKAAQYLKRKDFIQSKRLYLKARAVLESHRSYDVSKHEVDMQLKIAEESGKVASNLSMLCLKIGEKTEALEYANEAANSCPMWPKAHSRRALALVTLKRYDDAQVAIFNAIKKCEKKCVVGEDLSKKQQELKEYNKIKNDIDAKLGGAHQRQSPFDGNILYKQLDFKLGREDEEAGTLFSIANQGVMDAVFSFLSLADVVQLEGTCKRFAVDPERGRRIAFTSRCCWRFLNAEASSVQDKVAFQTSLEKFTSCVEESPRKALQKFVLEVRDKVDDDIWR